MKPTDWDVIAQDYYTEILSPLRDAHTSPLDDAIATLPKSAVVADVGCGTGPLIPMLSKSFAEVHAIDFSKKMIDIAKANNAGYDNVFFYVEDMTKLRKWGNKFDVVFSINSLLETDTVKLQRQVQRIYKMLKKGGKIIAILPAMEVYLFQAMLLREKLRSKGMDKKMTRKEIYNAFPMKEHDFLRGIFTYEGDSQKAYYEFEVKHRLNKEGFKNIKISKVYYSWKEFKKAGQLYFPSADLPWDWFVTAEKP